MKEIISTIISTVLQLAVFTIIPYLFFLYNKRGKTFFGYIGVVRPSRRAINYSISTSLLFVGIGLGLPLLNEDINMAFLATQAIGGKLKAIESTASQIIVLLILALLKTSLTEEILFRGFIAKRLISWLGITTGNILQAIIFGSVHFALFYFLLHVSLDGALLLFLFSSVAAFSIGHIMEKYGNGSIIPGWISHGFGNVISYVVIVFIY